ELTAYGEQLGAILEHAERVQQLPTEGIPPTSHPVPMTNSFRPDEVTGSLTPEEALSGAPEAENGYFKVPPVLGDE
ncbi:MAG: Asp-tRNA(Asn)/Glu-tRNA(Gln) amidotransferase subunit GatC, partial [Acidimicrobiia bacterium]|nr:Asp-tRNA(Asn)/Glu-tRNA(Gln) amidotransferase subunit GatC [Acidimicrobiia bacterium]